MLQPSAGELSFRLSKKSLGAPYSPCVSQRKGFALQPAAVSDLDDDTEMAPRSESRKTNSSRVSKPHSSGFGVAAISTLHPKPIAPWGRPRPLNSSIRRWGDICRQSGG